MTTHAVREHHSHGEGLADAALPDVVVFPHSNDEVAAIVRLCHLARVPVIAFGVGTSLEGHVAALYGGVCLDLSQMNRVLEVNAEDLDCRVQAGVTREQLNAELKGTGLFFPIDPGANATIGGMASTRASGTNAVRYGTMRENVLGLTVVTADGRIVRTGGRARKSSAGYDLTRLFVGAEGTLGVITEIQLRLYGVPEAIAAAVCQFPDLAGAVNTVIAGDADRHPGGADRVARRRADGRLHTLFEARRLRRQADAVLRVPRQRPRACASRPRAMRAISDEFGGSEFQWATQAEDRTRLWKARHAAYYATLAFKPGTTAIRHRRLRADFPPRRMHTRDQGRRREERPDGADRRPRRRRQFSSGRALRSGRCRRSASAPTRWRGAVSMRAIAMGGTCTGEHGIGWHKLDLLAQEHGEAVDLMRAIKRALDPHES